MNIKKDDKIIVISGKDKGKTGSVVRAIPSENKIVIAGVHVLKVHTRARKSGEKGQIIEKAMPIHVSNVMLLDPKSGKGTRVGSKMDGKKKVRVAKKSGQTI